MIESAVLRLLITLNSLAGNKVSEPRPLEKTSMRRYFSSKYLAPLSRRLAGFDELSVVKERE